MVNVSHWHCSHAKPNLTVTDTACPCFNTPQQQQHLTQTSSLVVILKEEGVRPQAVMVMVAQRVLAQEQEQEQDAKDHNPCAPSARHRTTRM